MRVLLQGEVVRHEEMIYRRGGAGHASTRRLEASSTPIHDEAGTIIAAITIPQDVEKRRRVQENLQQANSRLEEAVVERTLERDRVWNISPDLYVVIGFDGCSAA